MVLGKAEGTMYIKNITYNEFDQRVQVDYGNDATSTYDYYEKTQRLKNLTTTLNGQTLQNINYNYTDAGDIQSRENDFVEADGVARTSYQDYQYDTTNQLHRLVGSTGSYKVNSKEINNYQDTFMYDTIGNFVSKVQTNNEDKGTGLLLKGDTTYTYNYQYNPPSYHSRPHAVISTGEKAYQYDLNGNMTGWVAAANASLLMNFTWDDENRLTKTQDLAKTTQYKYDDKGKRIIKNGGNSEVVYVNDNYSIRNDDVTCKHIFAENTRVATKMTFPNATGGTYFYHGDHLGSSSVVTSDSKAFYEHLEYFPYGETWVQDKASSTQESMPYKFTGQIQDDETGLYYFGARYYEPKLSRWVSADKAFDKFLPSIKNKSNDLPGCGGVYNPVNLNVYSFTANNPVVYKDPDGNFWHIVAGAVVGGALNGIFTGFNGGSSEDVYKAIIIGGTFGGLAAATMGTSLVASSAWLGFGVSGTFSALNTATTQHFTSNGEVHGSDVALSFFLGGAGGTLSSKFARFVDASAMEDELIKATAKGWKGAMDSGLSIVTSSLENYISMPTLQAQENSLGTENIISETTINYNGWDKGGNNKNYGNIWDNTNWEFDWSSGDDWTFSTY